uniref:Pentatricopeptide repeat-containing protein n=1 Tax=Kalanchoe fedtschenkoi TaxID=63787 RepID=A0A7N0UKM6_KALFE
MGTCAVSRSPNPMRLLCLDYARELLNKMDEKDEITYNSVISGYMNYGFVDKALDLFHELKTPILSTWNALISGLVQNKWFAGIPELLQEMQASGFKPNSVTLSSILPMVSQLSNLRTGKEVHNFAVRNSLDCDKYVATAIIDTYAKSGFIHGAQTVFEKSKDKSLVIWTAIITAHASHGNANRALDMFQEMLNNGIRPDPVTFTAVLASCAHSGLVDDAWRIFNDMSTKFNVYPLAEQYACMIGVLSRAGRLSEAMDFISKMPVKPTAKVWGALLNGASVRGDVEVGKYAYDHLLQIEPECTGNYIIMANLYSQAGRWAEGEEVRGQMNKNKLKKIAGCSWIETNEGIQSFRAKDLSNERSEEIYEIVEGLLRVMVEEGYISNKEEFVEDLVCS